MWVPVEDEEPDVKERIYVNLLKLCRRWEIKDGANYAITQLTRAYHLDYEPIRRLELARMYSVPEWVEPAVRSLLVFRDFRLLTIDDAMRLTFPVVLSLVKGKEWLFRERCLVAKHPWKLEKDPSWECPDHKACCESWKAGWKKIVLSALLNYPNPVNFDDIPSLIEHSTFPGVTESCRKSAIKQMRDRGFADRQIIQLVADDIKKYFDSL